MARAVIRRLQVTGLWNILNVIEQQPNAGTVKNSWPQAQPTTGANCSQGRV